MIAGTPNAYWRDLPVSCGSSVKYVYCFDGLRSESKLCRRSGAGFLEMSAFRDGYKDNAEAQVKLSLAIEAIVKAEGIEASEDEINAEYENLAKTYGMDVEAVKKAIPADSLAGDIKSKKAIDLVKDSAKVTEEKATKKTAEKKDGEEKAPAKKTAAKKTTKKAADAE